MAADQTRSRRLLAIVTPKPGVRHGSHPGLVISKLCAAPKGRRRALLQVVADLPYFDSRACFFKLLFNFIRLFLVDPFLDRLRRRLDKVLRLLEAEAGDRPHLLDDVDLLLAERSQDHVELGLYLGHLGSRRAATASGGYRH